MERQIWNAVEAGENKRLNSPHCMLAARWISLVLKYVARPVASWQSCRYSCGKRFFAWFCLLQVYTTWEIPKPPQDYVVIPRGLRKGWVVSTQDPKMHMPQTGTGSLDLDIAGLKEDGNIWNSLRETGGDSRRRQRISLRHSHHSTDTQRRKWSAKCVQSEPFRFEELINIYIYIACR